MTVEELQARVLELEEQVKDKQDLERQLEEKESRIKSLEEHNQRLFLKATSTSKQEDEKEEKFTNDLLGDYANLLDEDEIQTFKEIMEEL